MTAIAIDAIGDVHGHLGALLALGRHLGYDVDHHWDHADGRLLVFLGDLIDRGPHSLEVAELVLQLVESGRALCLMGNHEYNLVGYDLVLEPAKSSNRDSVDDLYARPERWQPAIEFFQTLPLALELPELRLIHAVWHRECFDRVSRALAPPAPETDQPVPPRDRLRDAVVLRSPFEQDWLVEALPRQLVPPGSDQAHEVLIKGFETEARHPFPDNYGTIRKLERVTWWQQTGSAVVDLSKLLICGHYWNVPPLPGLHESFMPPYASGHPDLRDWHVRLARAVPEHGSRAVPLDVRAVCVDYNGVEKAGAGACVGAFRWPERQVAWVRVPSKP